MLINISEYFIESGREWRIGENTDVPREVAARWIADGKATADTDGVRNQSPVSGGGAPRKYLRAACIGTSIYSGAGLKAPDGTTILIGNTWAPMKPWEQCPGQDSWFTWLCLLSGGMIRHYLNGAISSDVLSNMVSRYYADIGQYRPDVVFFGDPTNDINGDQTDSDIRSRIDNLRLQIISSGATPILVMASPRGDNATKNQRTRQHNVWARYYADANGLMLIDPFAVMLDPESTSGYPLAGSTVDSLHPTMDTAQLAGLKALDDLAGVLVGNTVAGPSRMPWIAQDRAATPNLLANPLFQDDANADGSADGWAGSGTRTLGTEFGAVVGTYQQVVFTSPANFYFPITIDGVTHAVGDRIAFSALISVTNTASAQVAAGILKIGGAVYSSTAFGYGNSGSGLSLDVPWTPIYCEMTVPTGATLLRCGMFAAAGSGSMRMAQARAINLTKQYGISLG